MEAFDPEADLKRSNAERESVRGFWDRSHTDDLTVWLTGSTPQDVWARLDVEDRLTPGLVVLNIGVGRGFDTRALAERGCVVHVLDISPVALAKVADVATGWLASELEKLPADTFDLALSHLVAQHMNDADLTAQIRAVLRSLKPDGLMAVHYAQLLAGEDTREQTDDLMKGGGCCRSPEKMARLVREAGGRVLRSIPREQFPQFGSGYQVVHVGRP